MAKPTAREIIKRIKDNEKLDEKESVTFRLDKSMVTALRDKCKEAGIPMVKVIEQLLKGFLED